MVELRWRNIYSKVIFQGKKTLLKTVLEYRQKQPVVDASGAFCGYSEWSEWLLVPTVEEDES